MTLFEMHTCLDTHTYIRQMKYHFLFRKVQFNAQVSSEDYNMNETVCRQNVRLLSTCRFSTWHYVQQ
jgi:hypothetical protein